MNQLKNKLLLWPAVLLLLSGCISDSLDGCTPTPTEGDTNLYFEYPDFLTRIERVHVSIFDQQGQSVSHHLVEQAALRQYQGVQTRLDAGEYTVVCWGNANEQSRLEGFDTSCHIDSYNLVHPGRLQRAIPTTSDSLYHHVSTLSVPESGVKDTLHFVPAHIRLQVNVIGAEPAPRVLIHNLLADYTNDCSPCGEPVTYEPLRKVIPEEKRVNTQCDVLRFTTNNDIEVELCYDDTQETLYRLRIAKYLQLHNIQIEEGKETTLIITIRFEDGKVTVELNHWGGTPVDPELN